MADLQLHLEGIGRWFGRHVLFRGISAALLGGETCLVAGPNGSGKSTLMRIMAGVLRSSEGSVRLEKHGEIVKEEDRPLHTMLVAPYLGLYRDLSGRENLRFTVSSSTTLEREELISAALDRVGVRHAADRLVAHYSSGMVQRLRLAIAILRNPDICLLDEPWMNLDEDGRQLVMEEVERMQESGRVIVIASNDPALISTQFLHHIRLPDYGESTSGTTHSPAVRPEQS